MKLDLHRPEARATVATIVSLAWPTIIEQVMQTAVQYIDTAMVGALGTHATAAVGATGTVGWLVVSTFFALGIGFLSMIARACGAGDRESARKTASQAVFVVLAAGLVSTLMPLFLSQKIPVWMQVDESIQRLAGTYFFILYLPMLPRAATGIFGTLLRAAGDTKTPMKVGVMVNIINIILNFLLIYPTRTVSLLGLEMTLFGAGWGVVGAAVASAVAMTTGGVVITIALWRHPMISPKGMSLRPNREILAPCLRIALPNMFQRFGTALGFVAFSAMINSVGEVATATHTIANTVESAFYIPGYGMQTAAATLAGNALGADDKKRMRSLARMLLLLEIVLMIVSGGLLFVFAPQMMRLFSTSAEVILLGAVVLRMVAVSEPFYGVSIIIEGMMQGVGNTMTPFVCNIVGMWGIRIVGTWICTAQLGMGLVSAWACMIAHNLLLFVLFTVLYLRGTWNPLYRK